MIQMFTREGRSVQVAEGAKSFVQTRKCGRCGGAGGSDRWAHTGWTCFDCNGEKYRGTETVKVYTAEKLAKLNEAANKRHAKKIAEADVKMAEAMAQIAARKQAFLEANATLIARAQLYTVTAEGQEPGFIARVMEKATRECSITEAQAAAVIKSIEAIEERARVRQASGHIGKVGERIEIAVTVENVFTFERGKFGAPWVKECVSIVTMRDEAGNAIVSKSASFWSEKGKQFTIRATIKEHGSYKGECQTTVARVQVKATKEAKTNA